MTLTPRQIFAYLDLNEHLDDLDRAANLIVTAVGAQGDGDTIKKTHKELTGSWR